MASSVFRGKVVWITGASSGIGESLARHFANAGARLILSSRRKEELDRVAKACSGAESVAVLPIDLSQTESMNDAALRAVQIAGPFDVMIHNASVCQCSFVV